MIKRSPSEHGFHAVELRFDRLACACVRVLEGQRFLSDQAPRLPLPDCTARLCGCRYVHHADRREGDERRLGMRVMNSAELAVRNPRDRRIPHMGLR